MSGFSYTREEKALANVRKLDHDALVHIVATFVRWLDTEGRDDESVNGGDVVDEATTMLDSFELFEPKGQDHPAPEVAIEVADDARDLDVALVLPIDTAATPEEAVEHYKRQVGSWPVRLYEIRDQDTEELLWQVTERTDAEGKYEVETAAGEGD